MPITLTFHGACATVTGSCFELRTKRAGVLIDCGMFQGTKTVRELNYRPFPFDPRGIGQVLLTHAHIDHSGLLPKLVRDGFAGPIHATRATLDLLRFMLPDSAHIQETEVARLNARNRTRGRPAVTPIYTQADAEAALRLGRAHTYGAWIDVVAGIRARLWNAGHILGSASIEVEVGDGTDPLRLLFAGDLGPDEKAFHPDPDAPAGFDHLVVESTYGDRDRPDVTLAQRLDHLEREVRDAFAAGGNLLIPAFAVERTQELLDGLADLMGAGRIPRAPIYIDSPLAREITRVFARHGDTLSEGVAGSGLFRGAEIRFTESVAESKALNQVHRGAIILAASGMCEAGRIRHHLKNNLWRPEATVLFVGYQAAGTLGHLILSGERRVSIAGEEVEVRARIRSIEAFSAHADQGELVAWVRERLPVRGAIFLVHGDPPAMRALRERLVAIGCDPTRIVTPELDQGYDLTPTTGPVAHPAPARLDAGRAAAREDWHNAHARLRLDIAEALRRLPDDAARERLIARLRAQLEG
jgi:metallo-beta-lactamase family protein